MNHGMVLPNYHGAMTRTMNHWHSPHTKRKEVKSGTSTHSCTQAQHLPRQNMEGGNAMR